MGSKGGNSIATSMIYKTVEKYVMMGFQLVVQIVIARILCPEDYGVVAMMSVFINIANIFIQRGFSQALIQKKDADEIDFATAFTINLSLGTFLYVVLFVCSPAIARFYNQPMLTTTLRVLALILPISSTTSIVSAIEQKNMHFGVVFKCNVIGSFVSGCAGIIAALCGLGTWALIIQQLTSVVVGNRLYIHNSSWKPKLGYNAFSAKAMFGFGWKMLVAGLINEIYNELNSLIIGKKYSSADLAFYTKGKSFPTYVTMGVDNALTAVTLSAFSKKQDDLKYIHALFQKALVINSYMLFPILTILAVAASPLITVLLTDKWLPIAPFMQICCFTLAFHPIQALDMQAIAAVGRSDMRLKLELIKKPFGIILLILAIPYGPMAIAASAAVTSIFSLIIGTIACNKCIQYTVRKHFIDILPILTASAFTGVVVYSVGLIPLIPILKLLVQGVVGVGIYLLISIVFKMKGYKFLMEQLPRFLEKFKKHKKNDSI
ncbi:MAG: lipopolysaccharide biosynthesis protein [Alphaproteobacteria bacterium]|nr:lipopolysaccharide biosynthesis protein [Alphaproteobacteria bacterium]